MDRLSNNYKNNLIFDREFNDKEKLIYFECLITQAYKHNPNFKNMDKVKVKKNMENIIKEMKKAYFHSLQNSIIYIISSLRLWTRTDLPKSFKPDNDSEYYNTLYKKKYDILQKINSSLQSKKNIFT
jgi:hypothetical protein